VAVREGKWRCPYCSGVNRGSHLACGGCGATRDKDVAFFLEDDAPEVTDEALLSRARAGADWLCLFCGVSNTPDRDACRNCGAERGAAPSRPVRDLPLEIEPSASLPLTAVSAPAPARRFRPVAAAVLLLLVAFVMAAAWFGLRKTEETVTVAGFEWERKVAVEAWRTVREEAWEGSVPSSARVVSRRREVHHTERDQIGTRRVKAGTRDLGNGFFEDVYRDEPVYRERPVYRTKISYDVDKWVPDRTVRASGQDHAARWPDAGLRRGEREASRSEKLVVILNGRRTYRLELPEGRWAALQPGQPVSAVIRGGWSVLELR
jgi:Zn-finger in Ran binding protein and others